MLAELKRTELTVDREKAILVGVLLPNNTNDPRDPLGELASLAKTAGAIVAGQILQRRQRPDAGTYIGSGKVKEVAALARQLEANIILFDNDLSPAQIGAIERLVNKGYEDDPTEGIKVLDRSELILDIFATRAQTSEAKLQVELAQMQYTYPRLTKMWGHLDSLKGGGIGTRGPGETQLETDRRLVRKRIADLRRGIEQIQQRKSRLVEERNRGHFTVSVVGYTNAGKSTLFNTLTAAGTYADNKLFATLDTKTRAWKLDRGMEVLLSDTVGFVRDLPHNLVASFKATLEEAVHADLLLHVLDVSHPHAQAQYEAVQIVLKEIGVEGKPELLLLNKTDTEEGLHHANFWKTLRPDALPISARTGTGLGELTAAVAKAMQLRDQRVTLRVPVTNGRLISTIRGTMPVIEECLDDDTMTFLVSVDPRLLAQLRSFADLEIEEAELAHVVK
jgi:GTPase